MTIIDDRDLFNDEDLLDFEDPAHREDARRRMLATRPATVSAARILMFVQAASPLFLSIYAIATRSGGDGSAEATAMTTTTTTIADAAEAGRRGGGGSFVIGFLFFIGVIVALVWAGTRLARMTSSARTVALVVEAVLLLAASAMAMQGSIPGMAFLASVIAVLALLLAPATKHGIARAATADTSGRFDVRNLPGLDR